MKKTMSSITYISVGTRFYEIIPIYELDGSENYPPDKAAFMLRFYARFHPKRLKVSRYEVVHKALEITSVTIHDNGNAPRINYYCIPSPHNLDKRREALSWEITEEYIKTHLYDSVEKAVEACRILNLKLNAKGGTC